MDHFKLGGGLMLRWNPRMAGGNSDWNHSKSLARGILHDRVARRKLLGRMLWFALGLMAAGLWLIDGLLALNPWWFLLWWGGCAVVTLVVLLFALYDALAVIREERSKPR